LLPSYFLYIVIGQRKRFLKKYGEIRKMGEGVEKWLEIQLAARQAWCIGAGQREILASPPGPKYRSTAFIRLYRI